MTDLFTDEVKESIRARAKSYRDRQAKERERTENEAFALGWKCGEVNSGAKMALEIAEAHSQNLIIDIDLANQEVIRLRTLAIDLGYHYAMSLPADSWEDRVWTVVKDAGLLKAIRDEVEATADKHAKWR